MVAVLLGGGGRHLLLGQLLRRLGAELRVEDAGGARSPLLELPRPGVELSGALLACLVLEPLLLGALLSAGLGRCGWLVATAPDETVLGLG